MILDKIKLCIYSIPYILVAIKPIEKYPPNMNITLYLLYISVIFILGDSLLLFATLFGIPRPT
jgi:hypothetical protein